MKFVNQRHPLLLHPGVNQRKREVVELSPTYAQVDDRDLADLLNWFYGYSKQVNFHEYIKESEAVEYIALSDWSSFFEQSIPFLLARIAKTDIASLALAMQKMEDGVRSNPASGSLLPIFDFVYYELFLPFQKWELALDAWQAEVLQSAGNALNEIPPDFTFRARLNAVVKGNLRQQFLNFMALSNGANKWHGTGAFPFTTFVGQSGWDVQLIDTLSTNEAFLDAPGGAQGQFLQILDELSAIVQPVLAAFKRLVGEAPAHIKDSLEPLHAYWQERHAPHLGLLFTFLELFGRSQNDLNGLTKAHLDFFFQNVLRIKPRPNSPMKPTSCWKSQSTSTVTW
ncbi:MAG: hypothetical protein IPN76_17860 [Saprospiraceae bacterium]|nr:hypothetical protein [Saprospiraceae bacterium]